MDLFNRLMGTKFFYFLEHKIKINLHMEEFEKFAKSVVMWLIIRAINNIYLLYGNSKSDCHVLSSICDLAKIKKRTGTF